jgi:hypothetical protein
VAKRAPSSPEELLADWYRRVRESQFAHYEASKPLARANYMFGLPVVALSTFVGTSVFATLQEQAAIEFRIAVGCVSVLAAVLSSLQTFLRYAERAEKHRGVAVRYGALRREIEMLQANGAPYDAKKIDAIREKIDAISTEAPEVPQRIWNRTEALLKERTSG